MTARQLSDGNEDGQSLGQDADDKVGFHGSTPVAQATVTLVATAGTLGDVITTLQALQAALNTKGAVASS